MARTALKIGELAKRTGLTVRTLHHYDEIGLLSPARRTESGHREYGGPEVARLQQIASLRQLGLSLDEIRACLARPDHSARRVIELQIARLRGQMAAQQRLVERLEALANGMCSTEAASVGDLLTLITEMNRVEKYYTPEQLEQLRKRREEIGEDAIHQAEAEWPQLMAAVRAEMDKGTDPKSETVQRLARRWMELVNSFTGGDPGIERSLNNLYEHEETVRGMDVAPMREMAAYIQRALA